MKVLSPFGPKIAQLKFNKTAIDRINREVDRISSQKKLTKKYDYSKKLVGQVQQEIRLPKNFIRYATIKKRIPLPIAEINMKAIKFTSAMPLVNVMIL